MVLGLPLARAHFRTEVPEPLLGVPEPKGEGTGEGKMKERERETTHREVALPPW